MARWSSGWHLNGVQAVAGSSPARRSTWASTLRHDPAIDDRAGLLQKRAPVTMLPCKRSVGHTVEDWNDGGAPFWRLPQTLAIH